MLDLAGLGRTLPVFSFPEEAEMFKRLDGLDGDWEVREGVADDFFPHFFGTRERVESDVLDPLPGAMGDGAAGPAGIGPGRFVDRFLGAPAPRRGGGLTGGNPLTADRPSAWDTLLSCTG